MMKSSKIIKGIPSSFVFRNMKLDTDKGAGEAKLFVGPKSQLEEIDKFFKFDEGYGCRFDKPNLLEYLHEVKMEYVFQCINKYKDASIKTWQELYSTIASMKDSEMNINLTKHTDDKRVYVRADEEIFSKIFRKITVPKLTDVEFVRDDDEKVLVLLLHVNYEYKNYENAEDAITDEITYTTSYESPLSRNRILFGAPGTGKSFTLNKEAKELLSDYGYEERVTFHPDYSYANFVGTYKPVMISGDSAKEEIAYEYVPGPFMRVLAKALKSAMGDNPKPHLLIIEEINRANVAAVFGDVFQLLDRASNNASEYEIATTNEMRVYLAKELGVDKSAVETIKIPDNMFIWATMNSADQGVFPMDTAFKRRWDFTYLGIDDSEDDLIGKVVILGNENAKHQVEWNKLRKAINNFLAKEKINEDKQLGPYFIARNIVVPEEGTEIDDERFIHTFKSKVIMYLFEDAAKQKRSKLFEGCSENSSRYSEICREFEKKGIGIFHHDIQSEAEPKDLVSESLAGDE